MMGGASGKSTAAEEAGIFGLLAFLADPSACAERLKELQAAAKDARDAQTASQVSVAAALEEHTRAVELQATANTAVEKSAEGMKVVQAEQARLQGLETALDQRAEKIVVKESAQDKRETELSAKADALDLRESNVANLEAAVAALKQDYETKIAQLRTIAGA